MRPNEFIERWGSDGDPCIVLSQERLQKIKLKASTAQFLAIAGLPQSAAPCLSFGELSERSSPFGLKLSEVFSHLGKEFDHFIVLGFDGSGNPIAIDTLNEDEVVWLDHEADFAHQYMNSSVASLATFLLGYRDFVQNLQGSKGEDAFLDGDYDDAEIEQLRKKLSFIDAGAFEPNNFWSIELGTLKANQGRT
jgi:hypothetical protein